MMGGINYENYMNEWIFWCIYEIGDYDEMGFEIIECWILKNEWDVVILVGLMLSDFYCKGY